MKRFYRWSFVLIVGLAPAFAFAERDLAAAATNAVTQGTTIARALSLLGVFVGAIGFQVPGAANWARMILAGGLLGTGIAWGAPSLLNLFKSIFGG